MALAAAVDPGSPCQCRRSERAPTEEVKSGLSCRGPRGSVRSIFETV